MNDHRQSEIQTTNEPHPWIVTESAGDQELLDLLIKREDTIDRIVDKEVDENNELPGQLRNLEEAITDRKDELGIDPLQEP